MCSCFWQASNILTRVYCEMNARIVILGKIISLIFAYVVLIFSNVFLFKSIFLCPQTGGLYLYSSESLISQLGTVFSRASVIFLFTWTIEKSYLLQSYKADQYENAYICSSKIVDTISLGLNVTHLIHLLLVKSRMGKSQLFVHSFHNIHALLAGRIKGHIKTKTVYNLQIFSKCFSYANRILEGGYVSSGSGLGLFCLIVGIIMS
jgi:hypothetical protein